MERLIAEQLKKLRQIEPQKEYKERSFAAIVKTPQVAPIFSSRARWAFRFERKFAFAFLSVFALILIGGISFLGQQKASPNASLAALNNETLMREVQSADFQIYIKEANYFSQSADRVAMALEEISTNGEN